jgi:hypothetical protein
MSLSAQFVASVSNLMGSTDPEVARAQINGFCEIMMHSNPSTLIQDKRLTTLDVPRSPDVASDVSPS